MNTMSPTLTMAAIPLGGNTNKHASALAAVAAGTQVDSHTKLPRRSDVAKAQRRAGRKARQAVKRAAARAHSKSRL